MICDVNDIYKFNFLRSKRKPYLLHFYYEDVEKKNLELYKILKSLEIEYNDIPMIRFDYIKFTKVFLNINIPSPNHLLIIEGYESMKLIKITEILLIKNMLEYIRNKLQYKNKNTNEDFTNINYMKLRPYAVNGNRLKVDLIREEMFKSAEIQYKFPNSTAFFKEKSIAYKRYKKSLYQMQTPVLKELSSANPKNQQLISLPTTEKNNTIVLFNSSFRRNNLIYHHPKLQSNVDNTLKNIHIISPTKLNESIIKKTKDNIDIEKKLNEKPCIISSNSKNKYKLKNKDFVSGNITQNDKFKNKMIKNTDVKSHLISIYNQKEIQTKNNDNIDNVFDRRINKHTELKYFNFLNKNINKRVKVIHNKFNSLDFMQSIPRILTNSYNERKEIIKPYIDYSWKPKHKNNAKR